MIIIVVLAVVVAIMSSAKTVLTSRRLCNSLMLQCQTYITNRCECALGSSGVAVLGI